MSLVRKVALNNAVSTHMSWHTCASGLRRWLSSRVVSVLDSGAEGPGFKSQTVHTQRGSVHRATKLAAALLRVAGVTAGLAESNGSLPPGL